MGKYSFCTPRLYLKWVQIICYKQQQKINAIIYNTMILWCELKLNTVQHAVKKLFFQ